MSHHKKSIRWYQLGPVIIKSSVMLPFTECQASSDPSVHVSRARCLPKVPVGTQKEPFVEWIEKEAWITFNDEYCAYVSNGDTVQFLDVGTQHIATSHRQVIFSLVFSVLLLQRGVCLLHASATQRDGVARLYLGSSGAGKSTAALHDTLFGSTLLADDITPIFSNQEGILCTFQFEQASAVHPVGNPRVAWIQEKAHGTKSVRYDGKNMIEAAGNIAQEIRAFPVQELVFLGETGRDTNIEGRFATLMRVLDNLAATSLSRSLLGAQHLAFASKLVAQVTVLDDRQVQQRMQKVSINDNCCITNPLISSLQL